MKERSEKAFESMSERKTENKCTNMTTVILSMIDPAG